MYSASSWRKPGPITPTACCCATLGPRSHSASNSVVMGPGLRQDDAVGPTGRAVHPSRLGEDAAPQDDGSPEIPSKHWPSRPAGLLAPFLQDLRDRAVRLQLRQRGVDLAEQFGVALADADRDGAHGDG